MAPRSRAAPRPQSPTTGRNQLHALVDELDDNDLTPTLDFVRSLQRARRKGQDDAHLVAAGDCLYAWFKAAARQH
ncbi:MAG: hypothetical protein JO352_00235 [Chloroflexi bacterium]|nr:hypothetical protein [Chloroflexota bacterium]MBV9599797.1 hypothetical protein [Chloroflexota bacterium]